ncbi:hypothetical protein SAMN05443429_1102 [Cruoricaptor ignavus]|uniref:Thioredoxin n=1 Tax=Cruoricaptor ignavus TaxID=1118202 RepID=A0A1M6GS82_9FLAO|nr:hypothetical protein SAMN05443429_1102 [Cruoricaptor ignavus]
MVVVFDNWCSRCTNFVRVVKKIDWLQCLTFKDLEVFMTVEFPKG